MIYITCLDEVKSKKEYWYSLPNIHKSVLFKGKLSLESARRTLTGVSWPYNCIFRGQPHKHYTISIIIRVLDNCTSTYKTTYISHALISIYKAVDV